MCGYYTHGAESLLRDLLRTYTCKPIVANCRVLERRRGHHGGQRRGDIQAEMGRNQPRAGAAEAGWVEAARAGVGEAPPHLGEAAKIQGVREGTRGDVVGEVSGADAVRGHIETVRA